MAPTKQVLNWNLPFWDLHICSQARRLSIAISSLPIVDAFKEHYF